MEVMKISLAENFRAVFYAPFYALRSLDFAAREGVTVEWLEPRAPGTVFNEVKRGAVDVAWGGPMRVMRDLEVNPKSGSSLLCFGEVVSRDPFFLVGKSELRNFNLTALASMRLGVVSEVPTPWLCLQADLKAAGIDVAMMSDANRVIDELTMQQQVLAMKAGDLDVIQLFEPYVSEVLAERTGRLLYAACDRGPTVYTTFICSRDGMARNQCALAALTRALREVQDWIIAHGPNELAHVVAPFFPDISDSLLLSSIRRYYDCGIWASSPGISSIGFARLTHSLKSAGFIASAADYDSCVHCFEEIA